MTQNLPVTWHISALVQLRYFVTFATLDLSISLMTLLLGGIIFQLFLMEI